MRRRDMISGGTNKYFCGACGGLFRSIAVGYATEFLAGNEEGITVDKNLLCTACGTAHLARRKREDNFFTELLVRRVPETISVTPRHWEWHAKHQRRRAICDLEQWHFFVSDRFVQMWQHEKTVARRLSLLPKSKNQVIESTIGIMIFAVGCVIFIPVYCVGEIYDFLVSLPERLPANRRRKKEQLDDFEKRKEEHWRAYHHDVQVNSRELEAIRLPALQNRAALLYVGYELDNPLPLPDAFQDALASLGCGGCGATGTLTDRIVAGMKCPRCKADTLEELPDSDE